MTAETSIRMTNAGTNKDFIIAPPASYSRAKSQFALRIPRKKLRRIPSPGAKLPGILHHLANEICLEHLG
jgi:hypothetical protein